MGVPSQDPRVERRPPSFARPQAEFECFNGEAIQYLEFDAAAPNAMIILITMQSGSGDISVAITVDLSLGAICEYTYSSHVPPLFKGSGQDSPATYPLGTPEELDFRVHSWDIGVIRSGDDIVTGNVVLEWTQEKEGRSILLERKFYPVRIDGAKINVVFEDNAEFEIGQTDAHAPLADASDADDPADEAEASP